MSSYLAVSAAAWGVAMAVAPLLQIRSILAHRSARSVSVGYQQVLLGGFVLWLAYGVSIRNFALIVPNSIAIVVCVATIAIAARFRER